MPAPTVTSVTPVAGLSGGNNLVTVEGTDFDIQAVLGDPIPEVKVTFGIVEATEVKVLSATRLTCIAAPGAISLTTNTLLVDVSVENVEAGPNQGTGTLPDAYTYSRPDLTVETHLAACVRRLVLLLQEQLLVNTASTTHADYALQTADLLHRVEPADLPAVTVVGPALVEHRVINYNDLTLVTLPAGSSTPTDYERYDDVDAYGLNFDIRLKSELKMELLNMVQQAVSFMKRNRIITVPRDPLTPASGLVEYPLKFVSPFVVDDQPSRTNVREAVASWQIEGVLLESGDLVEAAKTVDTTPLITEQIP